VPWAIMSRSPVPRDVQRDVPEYDVPRNAKLPGGAGEDRPGRQGKVTVPLNTDVYHSR
jgi:hypothetical protein